MISLLTVMQVIHDRRSALIAEIQKVQTDKRVKDKSRIPALFARIEETEIILNLLKQHIEKQPAVPAGPIPRNGNNHPGLHPTLFERAPEDALGKEAETQKDRGLADPVTMHAGELTKILETSQRPLHPVQ